MTGSAPQAFDPRRPLAGHLVLDFSQYIPGPYATLILADLGARVVKIEPPAGEPMRRWGPPDGDGLSVFYKVLNAGKEVLFLDLKDAARRAGALALVRQADVLVESYRPGVLERLGLPRGLLAEANARLIHCALSGFGQTGPYRDRPGHDLTYMALNGALAVSGLPDQPVMAIPPTADYAAGLQAAASILAALLGRERSGRGAFLDLAVTDAVLAWQACSFSAAAAGSSFLRRGDGEESGGLAGYRLYRAGDGRFVSLAAQEPKFWAQFCMCVGRPEWVARHADPVPQSALIAELEALFATRGASEWEGLLGDADCCFQRILEPDEVEQDPQIRARRLIDRKGALREVLYPAWVEGLPPLGRLPIREVRLEDLLEGGGSA